MTSSASIQDHILRQQILEGALALFEKRGYEAVSLGDIAADSKISLDDLYRFFPRKEDFIAALYERLASDLEMKVTELPEGTIQERFVSILRGKLSLLKSQRETLRFLLPAMMNPENRLGVMGQFANKIRERVQAVFKRVVSGAKDKPEAADQDRVTRLLYAFHLACVYLVLQDSSEQDDLAAEMEESLPGWVNLLVRVLGRPRHNIAQRFMARMMGLPRMDGLAGKVDKLVRSFVQPPHDPAHFTLAENLLRALFLHRRLLPTAGACAKHACPECLSLHLPRVRHFLAQGRPIHFVLPAFPSKSANMKKVTGPLPDFGEELSLRFLQERCEEIRRRYEPGASITICSDGTVFNDLVGVEDDAVPRYREKLQAMIDRYDLNSISVFDLQDIHPGQDCKSLRDWLMEEYAEPLEVLEDRTRRFEHHRQMYNGIHRFLMEDLADREPKLSRNQARKRTREPAYEVIRRSNAWSRLVRHYFPDALRLSIHPQSPHSEKIGILLAPSEDAWLTPWHGVALLKEDQFVLTRREEAENLGASLVERDGQPSHYELKRPVKGGAES
jgi:pyoverdine/dityrosine biosynthesis protein Dit1/AcrR family transcriptional regulator